MIGAYPTPVERIDELGLWVKRDDLTNSVYGGNKVRKLEHLLAEAARKKKKRIVTVGAAGSHHVLATAIHGGRAGFAIEAALVPQRRTEHVVQNLRADLAAHATLRAARTYFGAALSVVAQTVRHDWGRDAYLVPMGGSNVTGSLGYVDAARELEAQVARGELPEPDAIVVTLGSGGTAAGLAAGLATSKLKTRVIGVVVAAPAWFVAFYTYRLLRRVYARIGGREPRALRGRLELVFDQLGAGYGEPTDAARRAMEIAGAHDLRLDLTYTAKCFAGALECVHTARFKNVLYWHTLSSAPLAPLLESAPRDVPSALAKLLR